jgi:hypothetical protein
MEEDACGIILTVDSGNLSVAHQSVTLLFHAKRSLRGLFWLKRKPLFFEVKRKGVLLSVKTLKYMKYYTTVQQFVLLT